MIQNCLVSKAILVGEKKEHPNVLMFPVVVPLNRCWKPGEQAVFAHVLEIIRGSVSGFAINASSPPGATHGGAGEDGRRLPAGREGSQDEEMLFPSDKQKTV